MDTYNYDLHIAVWYLQGELEKNAGAPVNDPIMQKEMKDYQYFEPAYKAYRDHFKEFYDTGVIVIAGTDMVMY